MQSNTYKRYLLGLLTVILVFNYVDRLALGVVLQNIKSELQLTDTQLGLLSGIAFALFYSVMGIPIARWADRGNRVTIIWLTTLLWSIAVMLCGVAMNFPELLLIRVGVAVGEAGCIPPALSLLSDYFSRSERPRALAIYGMGSGLACVAGYFLAGWLNQAYGWRQTFVILGSPGLLLTALAWLTFREPRIRPPSVDSISVTRKLTPPRKYGAGHPGVLEVLKSLWANRTFRHLLLCVSTMYLFLYGVLQWQPTFLIRSYHLQSGEVGTWLAAVYGLGGLLGPYLGGRLATQHAANNERLQLQAMAAAFVGSGLLSVPTYLSSHFSLSIILMALVNMCLTASFGPLFATLQTLVPSNMRAVSIALVYLFANLIGMGCGPLITGMLSDALFPWVGEESLRYALLALSPGYLWVAWHAWRAGLTVTADIAALGFNKEPEAGQSIAPEAPQPAVSTPSPE